MGLTEFENKLLIIEKKRNSLLEKLLKAEMKSQSYVREEPATRDISTNPDDNIPSEIYDEVANHIWEMAKKSPDHGNALMDIIGLDAYERVMKMKGETDAGRSEVCSES